MPARRYAFGRLRLTDAQMNLLLIFDRYRRHVAGRRHRPTLREVALEMGGMSSAGALSHLSALSDKGYLEQRTVGERRGFQLTERGLAWVKAKRRRLARAAKKKVLRVPKSRLTTTRPLDLGASTSPKRDG